MKKQNFIILFVFLSFTVCGQSKYSLQIINIETGKKIDYDYKTTFDSAIERGKEIDKVFQYYYSSGFLAFSADSIAEESLSQTLFINKGTAYNWLHLETKFINKDILKKAGYKEKNFKHTSININSLNKIKKNIIIESENKGYPFAEVKLDSISINQNEVKATLIHNLNNYIIYDSIILEGDAKIKNYFLINYLNIKKGKAYSESDFNKVEIKLRNLPFINIKSPSVFAFTDSSCNLLIHIDKKKASSFDGILGIIPDNATGKLILTGDVRLKLINAFEYGETAELNWKHLTGNSQRLKAGFSYPYLLKSNLGADYYFDLLQKDSSYVSVKHASALKYLFEGFNFVSLTADLFQSSMLNSAAFSSINVLPDFADVRTALVGMTIHKEDLDFRQNPKKGYTMALNIATGNKTIIKNTLIDESLYDGINLKTRQYRYELNSGVYFNPFKNNVLMLGLRGGALDNPTLFQNELLRLGGASLLRGFDEETIFASLYSLMTLEYRYIFQPLSYINLFFDACYYENKSINKRIIDRPYGFGTGLTFETKQGIFSISYALGKQFNNPVQLKSGKVHLGYTSFF